MKSLMLLLVAASTFAGEYCVTFDDGFKYCFPDNKEITGPGITDNIRCHGEREGDNYEVSLSLSRLNFDQATQTGSLNHYTLDIIQKSSIYEMAPDYEISQIAGENISNEPYNGRKYKNHLKFSLTKNPTVGKYAIEYANLIIAPNYVVVKETFSQNHWNPEIKWRKEIRRHSAVLDLSLNDHHGDYVPLKCYSSKSIRI